MGYGLGVSPRSLARCLDKTRKGAGLALAAGSSTRHLSCLETARSQPSREMILRLAEQLEIPLRDQNALLLAAGFAPAFQERSLAELENARPAIEQILEAHKPYPAFALDRHWNVVASNSALPQLYEGCSPELLRKPINALRLVLHPEGMGPRIVNFIEWRAHTITVLRQQIETRPDPVIQAFLTEVMIGIGGHLAVPPLPHHRAYGSRTTAVRPG